MLALRERVRSNRRISNLRKKLANGVQNGRSTWMTFSAGRRGNKFFIAIFSCSVFYLRFRAISLFVATQDDTNSSKASKECLAKREEVQAFCRTFECNKQFQPRKRERKSRHLFFRHKKEPQKCKTLWFSGFHEGVGSHCRDEHGGGYRMDYAASLASAKLNAGDVLQPVLLLGRLDLEDDEDVSGLRTWAENQGAIVVLIDSLLFQDDLNRWYSSGANKIENPGLLQGPFLYMDIPNVIREHKLFDLKGVCSPHVLITDPDVLFTNPITRKDLEELTSTMWRRDEAMIPALMYGRERSIRGKRPKNTGVIVMDVPRFEMLFPRMIQFRNEHPEHKYEAFDQGWFNLYFEARDHHLVEMLPLYWNWKLYWRLRPVQFNDLKIIHFHGAKPGRGAWMAARCDLDFLNRSQEFRPYHNGIANSICCDDFASTSFTTMNFYSQIEPNATLVCNNVK